MANALTSNYNPSQTAFGNMGAKASNFAGGGGYSTPGGFDFGSMIPGLSGIAQGIFGDSGAPAQAAGQAYEGIIDKYLPGVQQGFTPYQQAGETGLNNWQNALGKMGDPQGFMNNILSGYEESPWASFTRKYGQEGMNNAASASGMLGSGAMMKEAAQYNQDLTSKDMQTYLQSVLGINKDYLGGEAGMAGMGLDASKAYSDFMSRIIPGYAEAMGGSAYGQQAGGQSDMGSMLGGIGSVASMFF